MVDDNDKSHKKDSREIRAEGAYIEGNVKVTKGNIVGRDQYQANRNAKSIEPIFRPIFVIIEEHSELNSKEKHDLHSELEDIVTEVTKGEDVDETFLAARLKNIKRIAPDIFEIIVDTIISPGAGIASVIKKVAKRAKTQRGNK